MNATLASCLTNTSMAAAASAGEDGASGVAAEHALNTPWVLWEKRATKIEGEKFKDLFIPIGEFATVEQFWRCWTMCPKLSCVAGCAAFEEAYELVWPDLGSVHLATPALYRDVFSGPSGPSEISRPEAGGRARVSGADVYALFRKGIMPLTEFVDASGRTVTTHRIRSDRNKMSSALLC